ncbi:MAG: DUF1073 domain-containing protein [Bacteroidales bacterium]|nr:DUF1073 domain-containing protein [Bacteroidales bacterium]
MDASPVPPGRGLKGANPLSSAANAKAVHLGNTSNGPISGAGFDPLKKYGINEKVLRHYQNRCFITWNSCAIIAGHELVAPACSIPAEDAMAHGYHVVCNSDKHEQGEKHETSEVDFLKRIKSASDRMGISDLAIKLVTKKHIFGVIMAIPVMKVTDEDGNEVTGAKFDYTQEYDPDKITKNSYKGFAVVEPQWLTYEFDDESSMDPTSLHFYEPTYIVKPDGTKIHRSWVIRLVNKEVCDILKPTYYFGGLSLTQMLYERMWCADKIANEAPLLAMTKRLLIADGNMEQLINEPKKANLFFKAINYFRDNWSVFVKKPSAQVQQLDTSLADLTPVTMSQYQLVAAIAQIPVTKLMKNVPSGLQSTGQYEWDDYAQKLIGIQQKDIKPFIERHLELYCRSNYWENGAQRTDIDLTVEFDPIDMPKQQEKTQQASQQVQAASAMLGNGIATVAEARAFLRKTGNTFFDAIGTELPEILKKMEEAKDPEKQQQMMMQGGGMPGMEGMAGQQPSPEDMANQQNDRVFQDALASITGSQSTTTPSEGGEAPSSIFQNALSEVSENERPEASPESGSTGEGEEQMS